MNGIDLSNISGLFLGSNEYTQLYYGSTLIWSKGGPTPPTHDYEQDYLTTIGKGTGVISVTIASGVTQTQFTSISYSTNDGTTWTTTNNVDNQVVIVNVPVINGTKVLWKGVGNTTRADNNNIVNFTSTTNFDVEGNIMSILNGDNFYHSSFNSNYTYNLARLFYFNTYLIDASNLVLPVTTLVQSCYYQMFDHCSNMIYAPELPATTLATDCYNNMFNGCTSLTTAPALPATTLTQNCYMYMFRNCSSLTTAPTLSATTLTQNCYNAMFYGCTNLETAPELPATTLANGCYGNMFRNCTTLTTAPTLSAQTLTTNCYGYMFNGCTNLNYIKMLAIDISATNCLNNWVNNVAATGTFVKDSTMTTLPTGTSGIPSGWTVQDN